MKALKYISLIIFSLSLTACDTDLTITGCIEGDSVSGKTNSKIIFISRRIENSEDWNLYSMNMDGSGQEKITGLTVRCEKVVVSHSGKTVLFVHYSDDYFYELYSVNINGTGRTLIDRAKRYCGSPDWSMDDMKIIYSKSRNESTDDRDLVLFDVGTKNKQTITDTGNNISARFSIGNKIVYWCQNNSSGDIYLMNADGSEKQNIIADATCPVWSPGGNRIAYISKGDLNSSQIFVSSCDGSNSIQLTTSFLRSWDSGFPDFGNVDPQWTPDGRKIVYESDIDNGMPEVYIMNCDGTDKKRLTNTDRRNENAIVSADGNYILYSSNRDLSYSFDIFIMNLNGENQHPLSRYAGDDSFPVIVSE